MNCYVCDEDICHKCVEPVTLSFFFATGSMYILCSACSPAELFVCPDTNMAECSDKLEQYYCALCQDWHFGARPEDNLDQFEAKNSTTFQNVLQNSMAQL